MLSCRIPTICLLAMLWLLIPASALAQGVIIENNGADADASAQGGVILENNGADSKSSAASSDPLADLVVLATLKSKAFQAAHKACKGDIKKFCEGIKPGGGRIAACLLLNHNQLSDDCGDQVATIKRDHQRFQSACGGDYRKHCGAVKPGKGRGIACLMRNHKKLNNACREQLTNKKISSGRGKK